MLYARLHTMLAEMSVCAEWTETGGGVGVLSNAASSVLTLDRDTHVRAAVRCRHTQHSLTAVHITSPRHN